MRSPNSNTVASLPLPVALLSASLLTIGISARVAPLLDPQGRGLRQFPTEDGYLMLTVARNLGLGLGMSTASGELPTNGVQPLATFVYAACFWLADGDRVTGVLLAQGLQVALACLAAWLLWKIAREVLAPEPGGAGFAAVATALWFAAPNTVRNSLNCLETGAFALVLIAFCLFTLRLPARAIWSLGACATAGAWLGLAFWVRNDAILLAAAFCAQRLLAAWRGEGVEVRRAFVETGVIGASAALLALPWVAHNWLRFGYAMPISGVAESDGSRLGENLPYLPAAFAEYIAPPLQIPSQYELHPAVIGLALLAIAAWVAGVWTLRRRASAPVRRFGEVFLLWALFLCAFYGLAFGASHFVNRYVFALSAFLAVGSVAIVARVAASLPWGRAAALGAAGLAAVALAAALNLRIYRAGMEHMHFQVVEWVAEHVPDDVWVAAIQTGTLGFFHDRTLNLDGKVNPRALEARLAGRTQEYVLETPAQFLVDWTGIAAWAKGTALEGRFEVIELDPERNLAVLRRIETPPPHGS